MLRKKIYVFLLLFIGVSSLVPMEKVGGNGEGRPRSKSVGGPEDLRRRRPRSEDEGAAETRKFETQYEKQIEGIYEYANARVAVFLETGTYEAKGGPVLLQCAQLLNAETTPMIVTGALLGAFFALQGWEETSEDDLNGADLVSELRKTYKRMQELNEFLVHAGRMKKSLIAEQDARAVPDNHELDIDIQNKKIAIIKAFNEEDIKKLAEMEKVEAKFASDFEKFKSRKAKNPEFEFNHYFKYILDFHFDHWNISKHPTADLFLLVPKKYQADREAITEQSPAYQALVPTATEYKEGSFIQNRASSLAVKVGDNEYLREEMATGFNLRKLDKIGTMKELTEALGRSWKLMFFSRSVQPFDRASLEDMFITPSKDLQKVFPNFLMYIIGYGDSTGRIVGLQKEGFLGFVERMSMITNTLYYVNCYDNQSRLTLFGEQLMVDIYNKNPHFSLIAGSIEEPGAYSNIALLPHLFSQEPLPFNLMMFFSQLQETASWTEKKLDKIWEEVQTAAQAAQAGQAGPVGPQQYMEERYKSRYTNEVLPERYKRLRVVVDYATPPILHNTVMAGTQIPMIWNVERAKFLPLLADDELLFDTRNQTIDIKNEKIIFFETADGTQLRIASEASYMPMFVSLTPASEKITYIGTVHGKVTLAQFAGEAFFSTHIASKKIWRINQLQLLNDDRSQVVQYHDVTITHDPSFSGWISRAGNKGTISYKLAGANGIEWHTAEWDFKNNSLKKQKKVLGPKKAHTADYKVLTQPYQKTWSWNETYKLEARDGGAPEFIKRVIKEVERKRDEAQ